MKVTGDTSDTISIGRLAFITSLVVVLDQVTKFLVVSEIRYGEIIPVIPGFFNLILTYNLGAAFGIFSGLPDGLRSWVLFGSTALALGIVGYYMRTPHGQHRWARLAFAMIIGGAIGNLIDRLRLGMVVDFLDVYLGSYHWPAFNIADSCICIGVFLLVLSPEPKKGESGAP